MTAPRRFYTQAAATPECGVKLDALNLRTPGGAVFIAPTTALAEAIAAEWNAQGENIVPATMPLSQLAFATIDATAKNREQLHQYVAAFSETDLCCHRAEHPAELAERQGAAWDGLLDWFAITMGAHLPVVAGIVAASGHEAEVAKVRAAAMQLDDFRLTALAQAAGLSGSAVIGFALLHGAVTPEAAFEAAALDDLWSQEHWGVDDVAQTRLDRQRAEFDNIARFIATLGSP